MGGGIKQARKYNEKEMVGTKIPLEEEQLENSELKGVSKRYQDFGIFSNPVAFESQDTSFE